MRQNRHSFPIFIGLTIIAGSLVGCKSGNSAAQKPADALRPRGVDVYVEAVQAYQSGDQARAMARLEEATRINPNLRMAHSMLGDMYRAQGDWERARGQYESLVGLDPYGFSNHYRLGVTYQFLKRLEDAVGSYLRALNLNPTDARTNMNLGLTYLTLNQIDDAVKYIERASQLAPDSAEVWANLGVAYDARGSFEMAEAAYKKALELDRNQNVALLNLGANLIHQGKGNEAVSVMEEAIKRMDTAPAHKRYADALSLAKQYDQAIAEYDRALALEANYLPALNDKGFTLIKVYEKGLQLDEKPRMAALGLWHKSLELYPEQPRIQQAIQQWTQPQLFGPR